MAIDEDSVFYKDAMGIKAVKINLDFEDARRHLDNLFDVRLHLAGNGLFVSTRTQELVKFCTEAMEFLIEVRRFGDEITKAIDGH